jgi:beta-lactam-binding protein with PASTA domain
MKLNFKLPTMPKLPRLSDLKFPSLPLDLRKLDSLDRDQYRIAAFVLGSIILLMAAAGSAAFLLSLRGAEQTLVPEVRDLELAQALVKLQEKELYPRVSLRFTDDPADRGKIVEQKPAPGAIVKAGRRIQLTVSKGAVADRVENYVGQDLNEVKIHLQTLFASTRPLLRVREPPVYVFDKAPAGTILEQKPLPETEIAGPTQLEFVISRGPEKALIRVPDLMGLGILDATLQIEKADLPVKFSMRPALKGEKPGTIVSQLPAAGSMVSATAPASARVAVTVAAPKAEEGMAFGVYSRELPEYPYALRVSLEAMSPSGERSPVITLNHPGGLFTAPYFLPTGSVLVLTVLDLEVPPREELRSP